MQHQHPPLHPSFPMSLPVLGHLLRMHYLKKTASQAYKGDPAAARTLAHQYCRCPDGTTEHLLRTLLASNKSPGVTDALCQEVLENHDDLLCSLLRDYRIVPSDKKHRALFLFATGSLSKYSMLDCEPGHPILHEMYSHASEKTRIFVRNAAVRYHAEALFADAVTHQGIPARDLSPEEWEIVVGGLISASRYTALYQLLLDAPVAYAVPAIHALHGAGWAPGNTFLRELWDQVVRSAPRRWTYPGVSGEKRRILESPGSRTRFLTFSPDGSLLAATGYDGTIHILEVARGTLISACNHGEGSSCPVFSPDNRYFLTLNGGALISRNVSDGKALFSLTGGDRESSIIAMSRDGRRVAFPLAVSGLTVAGLPDGNIVRSLATDTLVTALAFSPDGDKIACGLQDGSVQMISIDTGRVTWESDCLPGRIEHLTFSDKGFGLIAIPENAYPLLLEETTGSCIRVFNAPHKPREGMSSPDGCWIFITNTDDSISIFQPGEVSPVGNIPSRRGGIGSTAFLPDRKTAVTGGIDGIIRIFRFNSDEPEMMFTGHRGGIQALAVSPAGTLFASAGWDGMVKLWDLPGGNLLRSIDARGGAVTCLTAAADGTLLAVGTDEGLVRLWRLPEGEYLSTMDVFTGSVGSIAVNRNGTLIATAGSDATVRIWEVSSGSLVSTLAGLKSRSYCLNFTHDSTGILAGGWDETIRLFRVSDGNLLRSFRGHSNIITSIAIVRNGKEFVSGSGDGTCRIWNITGNDAPRVCRGDGAGIDAVAVSQEGTVVAAADRSGKIRIYSGDGTSKCTLTGVPSRVTGLVMVPGDDLLAASSDDGSIAYFSLRQQMHIRNFSAHAGKIRGMAAGGTDTHTASAGEDGTVQLLPVPFSLPLSSLSPDFVPVAIREAQGSHQPEREQWIFLSALLALKHPYDICLCSPPPAVDEHEIMIVG